MTPRSSSLALRWLSFVRRPGFWLGVQLVLVWFVAAQTGSLRYERVPDTPSYLGAAGSTTVEEALSQYRTYGYPLFLRLFESEGEIHLRQVPTVHLLAFLSAIAVFAWALGRFLGSGWLALAAASPLAYAPAMSLLPKIQPDFLAAAFLILTLACLMLLVDRRTVGLWLALAIAVFTSYQLRPASAFIVGFVPVCGWLFVTLRNRVRPGQAIRFAAVLAALTFGPFLAFAGLRGAITGHFGLVSFGGFNLAGITSCFLDGKLVDDLPEEDRRLARRITAQRGKRGFKPLRHGDDPEAWFEQISPNIFHISLQVVKTHMKEEIDSVDSEVRLIGGLPVTWAVEVNRRLSRLSVEILRRRLRLYRDWVRSAFGYGLRQLPEWPWIALPFVLLVITSPLVALRVAARPRLHADPEASHRARSLACLALAAIGFFAIYLTLVSSLSFPFSRYFVSTVLFIPSALTALLFESWRLIAAPDA